MVRLTENSGSRMRSEGGGSATMAGQAADMTSSQRIAESLIDDISAGRIAPGARLDEHGLAARFGTSRTPVREALARLAARGVLRSEWGRGVFVSDYGKEELSEMLEAMQELEEICSRLAAKRLTLRNEAAILSAHRKCAEAAEAGDLPGFLKANDAFHHAIYEATQNRFVSEIASEFRYRTGPFRAKRFRTKDDMLDSVRLHGSLVKTVLGRADAPPAEALRREVSLKYIEALDQA